MWDWSVPLNLRSLHFPGRTEEKHVKSHDKHSTMGSQYIPHQYKNMTLHYAKTQRMAIQKILTLNT